MSRWPSEAEGRDALCRVGAELHRGGLLAGRAGNLSVRIAEGAIVVTPAGGHKGHLEPDGLVRLSLEDPEAGGDGAATSELPVHLAAYRARPDVGAVVHTHAPALTALGVRGLDPGEALPEIGDALGGIALVEFEESGSEALGRAVGRALADGPCLLLLRRHGTVAVAPTPEEARDRTELAELSAYTVLLARHGGEAVDPERVERLRREVASRARGAGADR